MAPSKISQILKAIEGTAYVEAPLQDYHAALAVRNAMRCNTQEKRLSAVREALRHHRVSSWSHDANRIELQLQGKILLII